MTPPSIQSLIHRHLDGTANPEETSRLALALLDDPAAAHAFAQATRLEAGLRSCFQADAVGRKLAEGMRFDAAQRRGPGLRTWAAAAAAIIIGGLSLVWWRPWARPAATAVVAGNPGAIPRTLTEAPAPPPSLRRPGALSPAAAEVKRLASRYWLPDTIDFAGTPLEAAASTLQQRATAVNHRQNGTIASFAIDLPEELAGLPVTATRAGLPLGAWLELLSAQVSCELRYTETGVAFDPVDQPDRIETRQFPLPSVADADAPAEAPARLFSYARPWEEEPDFRSAPPHGTTLASAWGVPVPASTRVLVRDGRTLDVRHTRRTLRRIEGMLAVATADAGRPRVTFRAKEVPLPSASAVATVAAVDHAATADDFIVDLNLSPEVVEFEGFINYEKPVATTGVDTNGVEQTIELTESFIKQPVFAAASLGTGNRVVSNDEAAGLLASSDRLTSNWKVAYGLGYAAGRANAPWSEVASVVDRPSTETSASAEPGVYSSMVRQLVLPIDLPVMNQPARDPWQETVSSSARLGEQTWLATGAERPAVEGTEMLSVGFSLLDLQRPAPLSTTARLEGELVKLTGTYTPPGGGAPTDFQAYVGEGQAFVLQTEDSPAGVVDFDSGVGLETEPQRRAQSFHEYNFSLPALSTAQPIEGARLFGDVARLTSDGVINGRVEENVTVQAGLLANNVTTWNFVMAETTAATNAGIAQEYTSSSMNSPTVRGVVISPVLEWSSPVAK